MPVYHFLLKPAWNPPLIDRDGQEFLDDAAAYVHAVEVAREIIRNGEAKCRSYRLEVCDENLETCFEILFASVDESLECLPIDFRHSIIDAARATASLNESIGEARRTLREVGETLAMANEVLLPQRQ
jgi:hypothetical protein